MAAPLHVIAKILQKNNPQLCCGLFLKIPYKLLDAYCNKRQKKVNYMSFKEFAAQEAASKREAASDGSDKKSTHGSIAAQPAAQTEKVADAAPASKA